MKKIKIAYIVWAITLIIIICLLTGVGFLYQNKLKPYKALEERLVNITEKYVELNFVYPENGEEIKISLDTLISAKLLDDLSYNDDYCEGYVLLTQEGVYKYDAFIKCANYTTKGY